VVSGESPVAEKTLHQETRTFQVHQRRRLIGGALSVPIAAVLAVVVWVDHANGISFRVIWDLVWILIALIAIRIARLGVQVRGDRLIIRGFLRTRTFHASQVSGITLARGHSQQQFGSFWTPYVHFHGGDSIRLAALMVGGTRAGAPAMLVTRTQEIALSTAGEN
jgi:hypothetical protein